MSFKSTTTIAMCASFALGCASQTPGSNPRDMSAARHDAMARRETGEAEAHSAQYKRGSEPKARSSCPDLLGSTVCWSSDLDPTAEHLEHAQEAARRAAAHRLASHALRDAEARACEGVSDRDRDESPFDHREDVAAVSRLNEPDPGVPAGPGYESLSDRRARLDGVTVTFRARPGMTAQWLQRVVDCHVARNAALGHDVPEMAYCPLVPKGVTATVSSAATGFVVTLRASDAGTAQEVLRRAQALLAPRGQ